MAQSNNVELSKYELKGNVVQSKTILFYPGSGKINRASELNFKDGYIQSLTEQYLETHIKNSYNYSYQQGTESYTLHFTQFDHDKKIVDSTATFQLVEFQKLKFYYPKYKLKLDPRTYPNALDVLYTIKGERFFTMLILRKDSTISENNHFQDLRIQDFNKKGQIILQKFSEKYMNTYLYNAQGQVASDYFYENIMKRSRSIPRETIYFYENDPRGNWIKKVAISVNYRKKIDKNSFTVFEARELTYADGFTSGSSDYDEEFIKKKISTFK